MSAARESSGVTAHVCVSRNTGTATRDPTVPTEVTNGTAVSTPGAILLTASNSYTISNELPGMDADSRSASQKISHTLSH
jgi:hypothetical protein